MITKIIVNLSFETVISDHFQPNMVVAILSSPVEDWWPLQGSWLANKWNDVMEIPKASLVARGLRFLLPQGGTEGASMENVRLQTHESKWSPWWSWRESEVIQIWRRFWTPIWNEQFDCLKFQKAKNCWPPYLAWIFYVISYIGTSPEWLSPLSWPHGLERGGCSR